MRRYRLLVVVFLAGLASSAAAHDLFLKLADFLVQPAGEIRVTALNGTFTTSSNAVARARIADLSLVGPLGREQLDTSMVTAAGTRTQIRARVGPQGTYVMGLSTRPSEITLKGPQFNDYLKEEGLGRVLEARRKAGELEKGATERYAKHVKTIFQAGRHTSDSYKRALGYPVEIMPLRNPYDLHAGDTLRVRLLVDGKPARGIEVLAGGRSAAGAAIKEVSLLADSTGVAPVVLRATGVWYVKFISMKHVTEAQADYISNWATLTFAVLPKGKGN
ncbi:MAG TPA: DUF4198 domain-containing protein [Gemmatimonadales bacterium]|nr:DUF4198 domain-containing protein [Gemmatimonadales bacterium]